MSDPFLALGAVEEKADPFKALGAVEDNQPGELRWEEKRGFLDNLGRHIDAYTGAPVRAAIGALQGGGQAGSAYLKQFGRDPDAAPRGEQIAERAGISQAPVLEADESDIKDAFGNSEPGIAPLRNIGRAQAAGIGIDLAADPLNLIGPAGSAGKALSETRAAAKAAELAKAGGAAIGNAAKNGGLVAAETLTGVPRDVIRTYAGNLDEMNKMFAQHGGNLADAADSLRKKIQETIQARRRGLNSQLEAASELGKNPAAGTKPGIAPYTPISIKDADTGLAPYSEISFNKYPEGKVLQEEVRATPVRFDENPAKRMGVNLRPEDAPPILVPGEEQAIQSEMRTRPMTEVVQPNETKLGKARSTGEKEVIPGDQTILGKARPLDAHDRRFGEVSVKPVIARLEAAKAKLDPLIRDDRAAMARIDDLIGQIREVSIEDKTNGYYAHRIKQVLQDAATPSYDAARNPIFQGGPKAAEAARGGAAEARIIANSALPEEYAASNKALERLHRVEDRINKNMIKEGKSEAALLGAGSGNDRNRRMLEMLDAAAGTKSVDAADKLAAFRHFAKPIWSPADFTGKAVGRWALSMGLGSPGALKTAINAGAWGADLTKALAGKAGKISDATAAKLFEYLQTPEGRALVQSMRQPEQQVPTVAGEDDDGGQRSADVRDRVKKRKPSGGQ